MLSYEQLTALEAAYERAAAADARVQSEYSKGRNVLSRLSDWFEDEISERLRAAAEASSAELARLSTWRGLLVESPDTVHEQVLAFISACDALVAAAASADDAYGEAKHYWSNKAEAAGDAAAGAAKGAAGIVSWAGEHFGLIVLGVALVVLAPLVGVAATWIPKGASSSSRRRRSA